MVGIEFRFFFFIVGRLRCFLEDICIWVLEVKDDSLFFILLIGLSGSVFVG